MFKFIAFLFWSFLVFSTSMASELPIMALDDQGVINGSSAPFSGASFDTVFLIGPWGSDAQVNGQFESPSGSPAWNGWTSHDLTQNPGSKWHISNYNAADMNSTPDNLAMYCGDESFPACHANDVEGGYGNNYNELLQFTFTVANAAESAEVFTSGVLNHFSEPGYDYTRLGFETADGMIFLEEFDEVGVAIAFSHVFTYQPQDYFGPNHDQVRFVFKFSSDGAFSDEDCFYSGNGACQVDDLLFQCSNGDFEDFTDFQNGPGNWVTTTPIGSGDFAGLWMGLGDVDPCHTNFSSQVAFIDDGTRVPDVGPSHCLSWCYGPGGYIVNTTGGAAADTNPDAYLYNVVMSPVLTWPGDQYNGSIFNLDVYSHEDLSADAPGIFYIWDVRSAVNPADIESAPWKDNALIYYGGPGYVRAGNNITNLLEPGRTVVQVRFGAYELGWVWGWFGDDGYPAPYFDNVRLTAFMHEGPSLRTRETELAQDNFPEIGHFNMGNLASMNVRFDAAVNTRSDDDDNVPADAILCDVVSMRPGGIIVSNQLHYTVQRNPVFDSVRDPNWGVSGSTDGQPALNGDGNEIPDKFAYDLPDSGFLFPGDILHYYISATDEVGHTDPKTATLPADIAGFGDFSSPLTYSSSFQVNCLPRIFADGTTTGILFWNDAANRGGEDEWIGALLNGGLERGRDYDLYYTNSPPSGLGNGLGGRATAELLAGYKILLYTSGALGNYTISNGDNSHDPGDDVQLLTSWFEQNQVSALFCGDDLVSDLEQSGSLTSAFMTEYFNVVRESNDVRPLINNQTTPLVLVEEGNGIFFATPGWIAYGGCNSINSFDAVVAGPGAQRLARFGNPAGSPDYLWSAATYNQTDDDQIISLPYDLSFIYTNPDNPPRFRSARADMLADVINYFGIHTPTVPSDVPEAEVFSAQNYPNPFNPRTKIEFNLPRDGHLGLKVYNLRGELVKTLIDETRKMGVGSIVWDGTNDQGFGVSSGVYFYEARSGSEVKVGKMALVR